MKQAFWAAVAVSVLVAALPAHACGIRPQRRSREDIRDHSQAIVTGTLTYGYAVDPADESKTPDGLFVGEIVPTAVEKGDPAPHYAVRQNFWSFYCVGWGWEPSRQAPLRTYTGKFFLAGAGGGDYVILRYEP